MNNLYLIIGEDEKIVNFNLYNILAFLFKLILHTSSTFFKS